MIVKFRTNLGSRDANQLGLDHTSCQVGCDVDVKDPIAELLIARGIAEVLPKGKAKAVAPAKKIAKSKDSEIK